MKSLSVGPAVITATLFLLLSLFPQTSVCAPIQEWVSFYDGPINAADNAKALAVDDSGNVYVTGSRKATLYGTDYDYATIKYDAEGNQLWVASFNGPDFDSTDEPAAIAVDASGNVCVTGHADWGTIGKGLYRMDYTTVKYDTDGNELWVARYINYGDDYVYDMAMDGIGNVYVTGSMEGYYTGDRECATVKYDSDGNQLWVVFYNYDPYTADAGYAISVDDAGNVYVAGASAQEDDPYSYDYVTIKYDTDGNELWVARHGQAGETSEKPSAIALDIAGNVYVTGNGDTIKYNPNGVLLWAQSSHGVDITVDDSGNAYVISSVIWWDDMMMYFEYKTVKYDPDGNLLWDTRYRPGYAIALTLDDTSNIYVTGYSGLNLDTIKYDPDGNQLWVAEYSDPRYWYKTRPCGIVVDHSGNIYIAGVVEGSDDPAYQYEPDYITVKYGQCDDEDGDGYGNPASPSCQNPELDCDDSDPLVNPGMLEIPGNGIDDDCDPSTPDQPAYPPNSHAAVYGAESVIGSGVINQIVLLFIPIGAVIALRILRRKK